MIFRTWQREAGGDRARLYRERFCEKPFSGEGKATAIHEERKISVVGGDCFAQPLAPLSVTMDSSWRGGYITVHAVLLRDGKPVADGAEQVLLANRLSFKPDFAGKRGAICNWPAAK